MMITKKGIMIRVPVEGIRISGRNTQGVKVMNLTAGDLVVDVARVVKEDEDEAVDEDGDDDETPRSTASKPKAPGPKPKAQASPSPSPEAQEVAWSLPGTSRKPRRGCGHRPPHPAASTSRSWGPISSSRTKQPIGAFKIRGAYNAIRKLPDAARKRGVITFSSGNPRPGGRVRGEAIQCACGDS